MTYDELSFEDKLSWLVREFSREGKKLDVPVQNIQGVKTYPDGVYEFPCDHVELLQRVRDCVFQLYASLGDVLGDYMRSV